MLNTLDSTLVSLKVEFDTGDPVFFGYMFASNTSMYIYDLNLYYMATFVVKFYRQTASFYFDSKK